MISIIVGAGRKDRVLPRRGNTSPFLISGDVLMIRELSIFVDESGDFGEYKQHSPYYIVALVFHEQAVDITTNVDHLNMILRVSGLPDCPIHTGPLFRREKEYKFLRLPERKRIFNFIYNFVRKTDIKYHTLVVEKKSLVNDLDLTVKLTKLLSVFLNTNLSELISYDRVIVYYDYGQMQLVTILVSVFNMIFNDVEFKKVNPADYKLCQAADMFCTMELLTLKANQKQLSKSELKFFSSERKLRKEYLNPILNKRFVQH